MTMLPIQAIWKLSPEYVSKQFPLPPASGEKPVYLVLVTDKNRWFGTYSKFGIDDLISNNEIDSNRITTLGEFHGDFWNTLKNLMLSGELPDPIWGTDPFKKTQPVAICTCDSLELFRFGCPSARGKQCRSQK